MDLDMYLSLIIQILVCNESVVNSSLLIFVLQFRGANLYKFIGVINNMIHITLHKRFY